MTSHTAGTSLHAPVVPVNATLADYQKSAVPSTQVIVDGLDDTTATAAEVAPLGSDRVTPTPRCGFSTKPVPCGPCCSLDEDSIWSELLQGVHHSVLDEASTADYWVNIHRYESCSETGHSLVEQEYIVRLTVGAAVGARRPKIESWIDEYLPGGVIYDYCLWGDWPEFRDEFEKPF